MRRLFMSWWWEPIKWAGRLLLWVLFFPLGLWRSIRHGANKRDRKASQQRERQHREVLDALRRGDPPRQ